MGNSNSTAEENSRGGGGSSGRGHGGNKAAKTPEELEAEEDERVFQEELGRCEAKEKQTIEFYLKYYPNLPKGWILCAVRAFGPQEKPAPVSTSSTGDLLLW